MKARRMMDGASYGPDVLKVIGQAFDEAWRDIAGNFGDDPAEIEFGAAQIGHRPAVGCQ